MSTLTLTRACGGCGEPIHKGSTGEWLDERAFRWCWRDEFQPHYPMSVTQQVAHDTIQEDWT